MIYFCLTTSFVSSFQFNFHFQIHVCSGSVVVAAYDFESGRPGSNPEWQWVRVNKLYGFDHCTGLTRAFIHPG